jgi:hypothetical protein
MPWLALSSLSTAPGGAKHLGEGAQARRVDGKRIRALRCSHRPFDQRRKLGHGTARKTNDAPEGAAMRIAP